MARKRHQAPMPEKRGAWWVLRYRDDAYDTEGRRRTVRRRVRLGPASLSEEKARQLAAEKLRPLNQRLITSGAAVSFEAFARTTYQATVMPLMASSTQARYRGIIDNYLIPAFGKLRLGDLTPRDLQAYLSSLSSTGLSHQSMRKVRDVLAGILGAAVRFEFLARNPAEGLRVPPARKGERAKPFLSPEQFEALLALIREPYATMVYVAGYSGLRVSELIALRWSDIHEDAITIDERYCRGDWGAPKTRASQATIPVPAGVVERIRRLRALTVEVRAGRAIRRYRAVKSDGPDDLVFPSLQAGRPMRDSNIYSNILSRHIKPAARALGLPWVNWQVLRRSYGTWLLKWAGADVKDTQAQMRHSRASTTLDIYTQFVPESQRRAVERLGQLGGGGIGPKTDPGPGQDPASR